MSDRSKLENSVRFTPPHRPPSPPKDAHRKLLGVLAVLLLSALGLCALVVWQRDVSAKAAAMDWATQTSAYLSEFYDKQGFLPARLPEELSLDVHADLSYPAANELLRLSKESGPYIVVARRRSGLITPGGDGCAVVIFDNDRFQARWLPFAEVLAAMDRNRFLAE